MKDCRLSLGMLLALALASCGPFSPERSAQAKITTTTGRSIYVNRLARGVSYDVMWISASSGECRVPSYGKDIAFHSLAGYPLYYELVPDGSIRLFGYGPVEVPTDFPVVILQETIPPGTWQNLERRYAAGEIQRVVLDLPDSDPCMFRWGDGQIE